MAVKQAGTTVGERVIESLKTAETTALEAVRTFVDTVNSAVGGLGLEDTRRKNIIDSAFKMTEELMGATNNVARGVMKASQDAVRGSEK